MNVNGIIFSGMSKQNNHITILLKRAALIAALLGLVTAANPVNQVFAGLKHELNISLYPQSHRLQGRDLITVPPGDRKTLTFALTPAATIRKVSVDDKPIPFFFAGGMLVISLEQTQSAPVKVVVEYEAVFNDPYPKRPANTDNPGYGVSGIIGPEGTFLMPGSGWYPRGETKAERFDIVVDAPEGVVAVTAGRSKGRKNDGGRTYSFWSVDRPIEALALSAGRYLVTEAAMGAVQVATYFLPQTQPLAQRYIAATQRYLKMYSDLFGPYPFEKFAVVENFFPTGYGFPSYTLLGGTVLRLPFIVDISLGHEIAHCWWGNGVQVDPKTGNWSEGLTTYVADYLYQEQKSAQAARGYRQQWLRNYAALVDAETDFPLAQFRSRVDRATKVIGYDKAAMVFHMLRKSLGDDAFWSALREIYRTKLFKPASWEDFRTVFERHDKTDADTDLKPFFDQWVYRTGAPQLELVAVKRKQIAQGWRVSGQVRQNGPVYSLSAILRIDTANGPIDKPISLAGRTTDFDLIVPDIPKAAILDPESDLFRRLTPKEIPPSVNTVKGAEAVTLVITESAGSAGKETARMLARALGLTRFKIKAETQVAPADLKDSATVYIGFPRNRDHLLTPPGPVRFIKKGVSIDGIRYTSRSDTFFGVFTSPHQTGKITAILAPVQPQLGPLVARKTTHYGKYGYLLFQQGKNKVKGSWPVTESPTIFRWKPEA